MNVEFYSLDQTTAENIVDLLHYDKDPSGISGVDFYSAEAKLCNIEFYETEWTLLNLLGISADDCIEETDILKKTMIISSKAWYIKKENISYNKKTQKFNITGIDLFGLLLAIGNAKKVFPAEETTGALELLETTINEILDIDPDIQFSIDSSAATQSVSTTDFQISFTHNDKFTGEPENTQGYYEIYEADIKWRYVGQPAGEEYPIVVMIEFHTSNYDQVEENMDFTYSFIKLRLIDEVLIQELNYTHVDGFQDKAYVDTIYNGLVGSYSGIGFPTTSDLIYSNTEGDYIITDSKLYFTGDVYFNNIKINEEEEDSGEAELDQNSVLESLLLLNNLYLYADGNILFIGNKTNFGGIADETIADADIVDYEEGHVIFRDLDFNSTMNIFENGVTFGRFLAYYYKTTIALINKKITARIVNNYTINLLDIKEFYLYSFSIIRVYLDNNEEFYEIEGWAE